MNAHVLRRWAAAGLSLGLTACATYTDLQNTELSTQQQYSQMREDYQRLKGQIEGLQLELDRMRADLDRMRSASNPQVQALQGTVDQLAQRLAAEEAARQRDKQEIVDTLSGRITKIMSSAPAPRPASTPPRKVTEGYEHIVEPGQTISAIAAAYKVKTSDILQANNITDPTKIRVGQKLIIPAP